MAGAFNQFFEARTKRAFLKNEKIFDIFTAFEIVTEFQPATVCTNSPLREFIFFSKVSTDVIRTEKPNSF